LRTDSHCGEIESNSTLDVIFTQDVLKWIEIVNIYSRFYNFKIEWFNEKGFIGVIECIPYHIYSSTEHSFLKNGKRLL